MQKMANVKEYKMIKKKEKQQTHGKKVAKQT